MSKILDFLDSEIYNTETSIIINTLNQHEQTCVIKNTININDEVAIVNENIVSNKINLEFTS